MSKNNRQAFQKKNKYSINLTMEDDYQDNQTNQGTGSYDGGAGSGYNENPQDELKNTSDNNSSKQANNHAPSDGNLFKDEARIFISGFPSKTPESQIKTFLETFGEPKDIFILYHDNGDFRGMLKVSYITKNPDELIQKINETQFQGRLLRSDYARTRYGYDPRNKKVQSHRLEPPLQRSDRYDSRGPHDSRDRERDRYYEQRRPPPLPSDRDRYHSRDQYQRSDPYGRSDPYARPDPYSPREYRRSDSHYQDDPYYRTSAQIPPPSSDQYYRNSYSDQTKPQMDRRPPPSYQHGSYY